MFFFVCKVVVVGYLQFFLSIFYTRFQHQCVLSECDRNPMFWFPFLPSVHVDAC